MTPESTVNGLLAQMTVLEKLSAAVNTYTHELVGGDESRSLSNVAWIVRSILELLIWMEYCSKSAENAMIFYVDAVRDFDDIVKRITPGDLDTNREAKSALESLYKARVPLLKILPPGELDKRYKDVRAAAQEVGKLALFEGNMKVLSKLAHPTAMVVMMMGQLPPDRAASIRNTLIRAGAEMVREAIAISTATAKSLMARANAEDEK